MHACIHPQLCLEHALYNIANTLFREIQTRIYDWVAVSSCKKTTSCKKWQSGVNQLCTIGNIYFCFCRTNIYMHTWMQFLMVNWKQFNWFYSMPYAITIPNQMVCNTYTALIHQIQFYQEIEIKKHQNKLKKMYGTKPIKWYLMSPS